MFRRIWTAELLTVIGAAGILVWLLLAKPVIGMADNGDFLRIMGTVGLDYADSSLDYADKYFGFFIREFAITDMGLGGYVTSSLIPVMLAKGLSRAFLGGGLFDMRFLALIYMLLFLAAAWLLARYNKRRSRWMNVLLCGLFVFMFTDVGYAAYYNSLFSEPAAFVSLLLLLGFASAMIRRSKPSTVLLTGFFAASLMFIGAKVQNAPLGIALVILMLRLAAFAPKGGLRRLAAGYAAALLAASIAMYFSLPKEIKVINEYQTVFYGILKGSDTPEQDLRELGLPEKLAVNAGTNYFEPAPIDQHDPVFASEYHPRFSHMKVALFYFKHPGRFYEKLNIAAENGMTIRPYYLGNYEKAENKPSGSIASDFSGWSEFKHRMLPNRLWFIAAVFVAYYAVIVRRYLEAFRIRDRISLELAALIGLLGAFQLLTPIIGDGEADLAKHLFGFNVSFDLMLLVSALWLAEQVRRLKIHRAVRRRTEQRGG